MEYEGPLLRSYIRLQGLSEMRAEKNRTLRHYRNIKDTLFDYSLKTKNKKYALF